MYQLPNDKKPKRWLFYFVGVFLVGYAGFMTGLHFASGNLNRIIAVFSAAMVITFALALASYCKVTIK